MPSSLRSRSPLVRLALVVLVGLSAALPATAVNVVASLPDVGAIAKEVVGEHGKVTVLASPEQDPHYVDPRPSHVVVLSRADLLIVNGLELEQAWLAPLLIQSRNSEILIGRRGYFDASTMVSLLQVPKMRIDRSMGDLHPGGNPHFTFDPRQAAKVAMGLAERLALIDPDHTADYRKNAQSFAEEVNALADKWRDKFDKLTGQQRRVVSYHQSLLYLWDWLGVQELVNVEPRPGIPPDPAHVAKVLKLMKAQGLNFIAQEDFYPTNVSQTLMKLTGSKTGIVLLEGATRFDKGQTYAQHVDHNAEVLYAAFEKQAK